MAKRKRALGTETRVSSHPSSSLLESNPKPKPVPRGRKKQLVTPTSAPGALEGARSIRAESNKGLSSVPNPDGKETPVAEDAIALGEDEVEEAGAEELAEAFSHPPPVNSSYLPLPWKGRLGYACLCTYLRYSSPPVFSSRTCRIASILENRHPLKDPSQPPHPTKNRPNNDLPADIARGQAYVEGLGLANAQDIVKMLRWNDKYGIRFLRLSSEIFPFASHEVYGYKLAPFASKVLAGAGQVASELGHRVTTHPGQFTQLGSPRKEVIENSIRDLEYHAEMLSLLKLPHQQNRDAVMILHMGGVFGDKEATLDRFRDNYKRLNQDVKNRLVLENDDVSWSVHDLLPICEELNIPLVLDYHHHNIIFDASKLRGGTLDIMSLYDRIRATWTRKQITQKMHYSEPTPAAITGHQRRKHSSRVATLPPCDPNMDLMIEAKDKEQAVFELMRTFKLPGYDLFNDMIPHRRTDENKSETARKRGKKAINDEETPSLEAIPTEEVGMGGPERRVYWPPGMEEWLRPAKRIAKIKDEVQMPNRTMKLGKRKSAADKEKVIPKPRLTPRISSQKKIAKSVPTPSTSDREESKGSFDESDQLTAAPNKRVKSAGQSSRARLNYVEDD